ncbi:MAG TPA: sigma-70 family RNA polymerase sigma factor [Steroidobacteraceae bacterium]|jgi:RNA polymerase sigma factor (sigma-70 family)|nr:sigma-70 family RNA polymerase sigma factor [Steroidobacteraceae bacterium]
MSHFLDIQVPEAVLDGARAGDSAARAQIFMALSKPVYTLIRRLVVRPAVAEELLQDVFVDILRNLSLYRGEGSFAGWVRSIAVSKALMHLRSPWHRRLLFEDAEGLLASQPADSSEGAHEWHGDLERALNELPAVARSIVWLHDVEGYKHAEIAQLFGQSVSFSKSQLARAHELLRHLLEPQTGVLTCTPAPRNS